MTVPLDTIHPDPATSVGLALWHVTNQWQRRIRAALRPYDLTHVQFVLLATLTWMGNHNLVTQHDLATQAETDPMMTSQVIRSLEKKGYVTRSPHPTDRRAIALAVTPKGVDLANRATKVVEAVDSDYFDALAPKLRTEFLQSLHLLTHR